MLRQSLLLLPEPGRSSLLTSGCSFCRCSAWVSQVSSSEKNRVHHTVFLAPRTLCGEMPAWS